MYTNNYATPLNKLFNHYVSTKTSKLDTKSVKEVNKILSLDCEMVRTN